jgi:hypothetical protein
MTKNTNNNKKSIGIVLASSAAVAVLTAGLIFGTAGCSTKQASTAFKPVKTVSVDQNNTKAAEAKKAKEEEKKEEPAPEPTAEEKLLIEIRDLLAQKK